MAQVKTIETKRINVVIEAPWGVFKRDYHRNKQKNILTIRFNFDAIKKKFSAFSFRTTAHAKWFVVGDLEKLRVLHKAIGEAFNEVEKLSN